MLEDPLHEREYIASHSRLVYATSGTCGWLHDAHKDSPIDHDTIRMRERELYWQYLSYELELMGVAWNEWHCVR